MKRKNGKGTTTTGHEYGQQQRWANDVGTYCCKIPKGSSPNPTSQIRGQICSRRNGTSQYVVGGFFIFSYNNKMFCNSFLLANEVLSMVACRMVKFNFNQVIMFTRICGYV